MKNFYIDFTKGDNINYIINFHLIIAPDINYDNQNI